MPSARFDYPSASLSLKGLLKGTRQGLWLGAALALGMHLIGAQVRALDEARKAATPLTTQFVKRQPRLTKPLELKKRPQPKRRQPRREMVAVKVRVDRRDVSSVVVPVQVVGGLARPQADVRRITGLQEITMEPEAVAEAIRGTMEAKGVVNMSVELLDVEALDTGRYHAMVIQDPTDKRNIKGFLHIAVVLPNSIVQESIAWINRYVVPSLVGLADAMNQRTSIRTDLLGRISLNCSETLKTPWIYLLAYANYELTPAEYEVVGDYVTSGGFLFCDEAIRVADASYVSVPKAHKRAFASGLEAQGLVEGRDWYTGKVPVAHPMFHCYFDFDRPPVGYVFSGISGYPIYIDDPAIGVFLGDALVGLISHDSYYAPWYSSTAAERGRALEFGINTIIYALTREGSITNRVMDTVSWE
jgi:hypothetical protein